MKDNILYLECESGISGDMTVAALLDLGADRQVLLDALKSLPLDGYSIEIRDVYKSGIRACDFNVVLDAKHENHDHDMAYLHGQTHDHAHPHWHDHDTPDPHEQNAPEHQDQDHGHNAQDHQGHAPGQNLPGHHGHSHDQDTPDHHVHAHTSRNLPDIVGIIRAGNLTEDATNLAIHIFEILARAEAHVHGKSIDEVHFHEVGAVDSIVDIVAAAVCLDNLHPKEIVVSPLTEGHGQIRCQHGLIPIPVPAVSAIAVQEGLIMKVSDVEGELVTPTGAAIAAAIRSRDALPEQFRIRKVGIGAGKRDYATAGVLRAMWIEDAKRTSQSKSNKGLGHTEYSATHDRTDLSEGITRIEDSALAGSPESMTCMEAPDRVGSPESMRCMEAPGRVGSPESMTCAQVPGQVDSSKIMAHRECAKKPDSADDPDKDSILVLETNIDDCTGEALAFTMQQLLSAGALDVFYIPIYMKKNRPAYLLKTICKPDDREPLEAIIFQNTTTIGIRRQSMQRTKLSREIIQMQTPWGLADMKCCRFENTVRFFPENDSVSRLALKNKIGFPEMYRLLQEFACAHA